MNNPYSAIFAAARERDMDKEDIYAHAAALFNREVSSLKELSGAEREQLRRSLSGPAKRRVGTAHHSPRPRRATGSVKLHASGKQRRLINQLICELGWDGQQAETWLREKLGTADVEFGAFTGPQATAALRSLFGHKRNAPCWRAAR